MRRTAFLLPLLAAGCMTPALEPLPASDATVVPALRPISTADVQTANLFGAGCNWHAGTDERPSVIGENSGAAIKIDGRIVMLLPDGNSAAGRFGSYTAYANERLRIEYRRGAGRERVVSSELLETPGSLVVTMRAGATTTLTPGRIVCGA